MTAQGITWLGRDYILTADCDTEGALWVRKMYLGVDDGELWGNWHHVAGPGTCVGQPELVQWQQDALMLLVRDSASRILQYSIAMDMSITSMGYARKYDESLIHSYTDVTATRHLEETCYFDTPCVYVAYADTTEEHDIHVMLLSGLDVRWTLTDWMIDSDYMKTRFKPGFLWHKWDAHEGGRFWLGWRWYYPGSGNDSNTPLLSFSDSDGRLTRHAHFNGPWTKSALGIDLMADGHKIRGTDVRIGSAGNDMRFWQNLDGLMPWLLSDYSDWHAIRYGLCLRLQGNGHVACLPMDDAGGVIPGGGRGGGGGSYVPTQGGAPGDPDPGYDPDWSQMPELGP